MLCASTSSPIEKAPASSDLRVFSVHCFLYLPLVALRPIQVPPNQQRAVRWCIQAGDDRMLLPFSLRILGTDQSLQYTYLLTLPLITTYSVGNAVIKYKEGFVFSPQYGCKKAPSCL